MHVRHKIPVSVLVVIHTPSLQVLLMNRADHPGFWQSVTGSQDKIDEPLLETAWREVGEETGIDCAPGGAFHRALRDWRRVNRYPIMARSLHRYAPGVTENTEHVFGLCVPESTPVRLDPREHSAFQWLPATEAATACTSATNRAAVLQLLRDDGLAQVERR